MFDLTPFIHSQMQEQIKAELNGKYVSAIFDGTTRLGEALTIIVVPKKLLLGIKFN